jgi:uncharacterized membrane protein
MTLAPLLAASPVIQIHVFAALAAFLLSVVQFAAPKGTLPHRTVGWLWVGLMTVTCLSSFFIHEIRLWGPWSPIHLLSIATLATLPVLVLHARRGRVRRHQGVVVILFVGALVVAGGFSFLPGRVMHAVVFGKPAPRASAVMTVDPVPARR